MENNYKEKLKQITTFCFDVDGVFTDGIVLLAEDGGQLRTANVRDGYAVQLAVKEGFRIAIITGGNNPAVRTRFKGLGVKDIFLGSSNKKEVLLEYVEKHELKLEEICYMGDDIPDYEVMQMVGLAACPKDAAPEIRALSHYVSPIKGGAGCVRELLEQTMKIHDKWMNGEAHIW